MGASLGKALSTFLSAVLLFVGFSNRIIANETNEVARIECASAFLDYFKNKKPLSQSALSLAIQDRIIQSLNRSFDLVKEVDLVSREYRSVLDLDVIFLMQEYGNVVSETLLELAVKERLVKRKLVIRAMGLIADKDEKIKKFLLDKLVEALKDGYLIKNLSRDQYEQNTTSREFFWDLVVGLMLYDADFMRKHLISIGVYVSGELPENLYGENIFYPTSREAFVLDYTTRSFKLGFVFPELLTLMRNTEKDILDLSDPSFATAMPASFAQYAMMTAVLREHILMVEIIEKAPITLAAQILSFLNQVGDKTFTVGETNFIIKAFRFLFKRLNGVSIPEDLEQALLWMLLKWVNSIRNVANNMESNPSQYGVLISLQRNLAEFVMSLKGIKFSRPGELKEILKRVEVMPYIREYSNAPNLKPAPWSVINEVISSW